MVKKSTVRDIIRAEAIRATARLYASENYRRWRTTKIYPQQIQATYKQAYRLLSESHPKMKWLQAIMNTPSRDIELKLVLRIPDHDIEIDIPGGDVKLSAVAHGGGRDLLLELLQILQKLGREINPPMPQIEIADSVGELFNKAEEIMVGKDESVQTNDTKSIGTTL
ncbi:MAG: hypothetical protein II670_02105 [Alphaproteobacteria bacterium]|nr:hypothetical protein [Alphaproteobacteria bacterium]